MSEHSTIEVIASGLLTTIQDLGRLGAQAQGVPIGGVLDRLSARQANWLVGNSVETPVLEITLTGPTLRFSQDTWIAICGGSLEAFLGNRPIQTYRSYLVKAGEVLRTGRISSGVRSYLAIGGDWQVERWLGSAGAWMMGEQTFPRGAHLQKGQTLSIIPQPRRVQFIGEGERTPHQVVIRVLAGPEWEWFSQESQRIFLERRWQVSNQSNRMAQKLEPLLPLAGSWRELISSPVWPGTIQCTASGELMILQADAQTTGGYPRLAQVVEADLDRLAQRKPGQTCSFIRIQGSEAQLLSTRYAAILQRWSYIN